MSNPSHVVIGHLGNLVDPNVYVHKQICRRGAFVGFDRQGGNNDAQQVPLVMALIEAGFADHLMFSADASSGYAKTVTVFLPKLKAAGAADEVLHKIMVRQSAPVSGVRAETAAEALTGHSKVSPCPG